MNFTHLKTFHRIAEKKSFTEAARDLFLSQPAVSMQMQALEHSLSVTLFDRSARRIALTPEGVILHEYTTKLFNLVSDMQAEFQDASKGMTGTLNIGATTIMSTYFLPPFIALFHERYPEVRLNLEVDNSHNIAEKLLQNTIDLAFGGSSSIHQGLKRHFLHREPLIVVCSPKSYLAAKDDVTALDLLDAHFVMRERGTRMEHKITAWLKEHAPVDKSPTFMTVGNMEASKQIIMRNCGITVIPRHAVLDEMQAGKIVQLPVNEMQLYVDYSLAYIKGKKINNIAQAFIGILFESGLPVPQDFFK